MVSCLFKESPELLFGSMAIIAAGSQINSKYLMTFGIVILMFFIYFYRVPYIDNEFVEYSNNYLLSPAFGTVNRIIPNYGPNGNRTLLTIFLNPIDIHSQYFPCNGRVLNQIYDNTGAFAIASDAYKSDLNEKVITTLVDTSAETGGNIIKITQIAGILVRRISTPNKIGKFIKRGEYLGFIKFGSRTDIEFDNGPNGYSLLPDIKVGTILAGPNSRLAIKNPLYLY